MSLKSFVSGNTPLQSVKVAGVTAANSAIILPANAFIQSIIVVGNNANAITGGLKFGTTGGGVDIVAAMPVAGSTIQQITDALLLKRLFSQSATQQIFFDAVTLWNSANVDVRILYNQLS